MPFSALSCIIGSSAFWGAVFGAGVRGNKMLSAMLTDMYCFVVSCGESDESQYDTGFQAGGGGGQFWFFARFITEKQAAVLYPF